MYLDPEDIRMRHDEKIEDDGGMYVEKELVLINYMTVGILAFLWLQQFTIGFNNLFGTELSETIAIFHSLGTIFIAVSILTYFMHGMQKESYKKAYKDGFKLIGGAGAPLVL